MDFNINLYTLVTNLRYKSFKKKLILWNHKLIFLHF